MTVVTDKVKIEQLVNDLQPYMTLIDNNLVGFKVAPKKERKKLNKKKWGRYVYATNDGEHLPLSEALLPCCHSLTDLFRDSLFSDRYCSVRGGYA